MSGAFTVDGLFQLRSNLSLPELADKSCGSPGLPKQENDSITGPLRHFITSSSDSHPQLVGSCPRKMNCSDIEIELIQFEIDLNFLISPLFA
ncbi:hypothetical protein BpHYR1_032715 [Brachionus plicatilis]|uniref:Uncharacterized protein n=1 Tax=Brachionus plicatilis TaxID=10195 RepID=A0A3M7QEJ5_BRAPC|nr:hypothetical protein BpHYR1_032715 [Brachionus plicatilis]